MYTPTHDIIIIGAGPAGSTLALMLADKARHPERIAVVGRIPAWPDATSGPHPNNVPDPRTLALNHGSRALLEHLEVWPTVWADIHTVHVSQQKRLGRTLIDRNDFDVPRLGSVVGYDALLATLHTRLRQSGVELFEHANASTTLSDQHVTCTLPHTSLHAAVAVQSDGRQPHGLQRQYRQNALLATARASHPQPGMAYERFTPQGPLALLPHPEDSSVYAVVWCSPSQYAHNLEALDRTRFDTALNQHFGDRLGVLQSVGQRHVFPLSLHAGPSLINPRTVAIGNAAQTLHPVAGQGLNLGLRDVAQLALTLTPWLARPAADATPYLHKYTRHRRPDRWVTAGITDFLPRVFSTGNSIIEHGCGLGLLGLDLLPPVRHTLGRHLLQGLRT